MIARILAGAVAAFVATGALAETVTMSAPIEAGSLHEGPLDMVAYWVPLADERYEVTATFIARGEGARPMRIVMAMAADDRVAFSMPGHLDALYRFARTSDGVAASVEPTRLHVATRD
jgi:hypothetical protein